MTLARDGWAALRRFTPARVGLGRSGVSLPTVRHLELQEALALARDAVHEPFAVDALVAELRALGIKTVQCKSAAPDRATYLRRPDLGRRLTPEGRATLLSSHHAPVDLALVVADGLSAAASRLHATALVGALFDLLLSTKWKLGPVVLVEQGRVAVGDEIAEILSAQMVVVLIGERPGLSAADSLGAYVTWAPRCRMPRRATKLHLQHPRRRAHRPECGPSAGRASRLGPRQPTQRSRSGPALGFRGTSSARIICPVREPPLSLASVWMASSLAATAQSIG